MQNYHKKLITFERMETNWRFQGRDLCCQQLSLFLPANDHVDDVWKKKNDFKNREREREREHLLVYWSIQFNILSSFIESFNSI